MLRPLIVLGFLVVATAGLAQVSVGTLLPQMTDLSRLARRPAPFFHTAQASSYDRASKDPETDWFANADAGKFVRTEQVQGRREYVMADLKGPGAVVRIWSANPTATIRFYFDGEESPRLEAKMADLLGGRVAPWGDPYAYFSARGANLYFPFPYQRALRITVDDSDANRAAHLYYHVNYRSYEQGTVVTTFDPASIPLLLPQIEATRQALLDPPRPEGRSTGTTSQDIFTGRTATLLDLTGPAEITELEIEVAPRDPVARDSVEEWRMMRSLILEGWFDGEKCIEAPLGDFFSSAPGIVEYRTFPMEVAGDRLVSRFVMPFAQSARFRVANLGPAVIVSCRALVRPTRFDEGTYHFKAQWGGQTRRTRPMHDMNFLTTSGEGRLLGSNMFIENPDDAWWGEGDEKIYVDGEKFPSTFGTGTEDYYGYAWCDTQTFLRPYHAQPRCDGMEFGSNRGHSTVLRWHILDSIPFKTSLRFDMECWHWADVVAGFMHTVYWYGRPGTPGPRPIGTSLTLPSKVPGPKQVEGALEGEKMALSKTAGTTQVQAFGNLSAARQIWWRDAPVGAKLTLKVPIAKAGRYQVTGNFCFAKDYGRHKITLNGREIEGSPKDFYNPELEWRVLEVGTFDLPAGEVDLVVEVLEPNSTAEPRNMFGLDYLLLKP